MSITPDNMMVSRAAFRIEVARWTTKFRERKRPLDRDAIAGEIARENPGCHPDHVESIANCVMVQLWCLDDEKGSQ